MADDKVGVSFQDMASLNHTSRGMGTMGGVPPPTFRFKSRRILKLDPTATDEKSDDLKSNSLFTPRDQNLRGATIRDIDEEDEDAYEHYTPDWFKMSIRVVDRENAEQEVDQETETVCQKMEEVLKLRDKWLYKPANSNHIGASLAYSEITTEVKGAKFPDSWAHKYDLKFVKGVMHIHSKQAQHEVFEEMSFDEYRADLQTVMDLTAFGPAKTMCYRRLKILQSRFTLHNWLNDKVEIMEVKSVPHRDFYNVRKIDNHIHHSACMNQKHLLKFIKKKLRQEPKTIVFKTREGKEETLEEVFEDIGLTAHELNMDALDMHAHQETFQRFDKFNAKYNPAGKAALRTVFLKIDNVIQGRFLAEITKEVMAQLEGSRYQFAEWRLSIYGRKKKEWDIMGDWIVNNKLFNPNVVWLIQMPRIYNVWKKIGIPSIKCFNDMMENFFEPLFEVTLNPASHPTLHLFLQTVVGFDSVDDESQPEQKRKRYADPSQWTQKENPPYIYYAYYMYTNITKLNKLREERGMNTFGFRPHCGEAGGFDHLGCAFLVANGINHGIRLRESPVLQYMYYLKQIGMSMSPLSNNILFCSYDNNPFPTFFKRGLNVSLSTDDPLLIHYTEDALLEEFSIAAQVYNLSAIDMCELSRNSVLQCGFDDDFKKHCIGRKYHVRGSAGNNIYQSNVPDARLDFRDSLMKEEENFIKYGGYAKEMQTVMKRGSFGSYVDTKGIKPEDAKGVLAELLSRPSKSIEDSKAKTQSPSVVSPSISISPSEKSNKLPAMTHGKSVPSPHMMDPRRLLSATKHGKSMRVLIDAQSYATKRTKSAADSDSVVMSPPPHDEWVKLTEERARLSTIRSELEAFVRKNKLSGNKVAGLDKLETMLNISRGVRHSVPLDSVSEDDETDSDIEKKGTLLPSRTKKGRKKAKKDGKGVKISTEPPKTEFVEVPQDVVDIRGEYFDESDQLNEIDQQYNLRLANSQFVVKMTAEEKSDEEAVRTLTVDFKKSKQEEMADDPSVENLMDHDLLDSDDKALKCTLHVEQEELVWESGSIWFKKDWAILVGAWTDPDNNLIEIRKDNTLRYIDGYGPFEGEWIGFKKLHVKMPNGEWMEGELMDDKEIKWDNDEMWHRCTDQGCLIM